MHQNQLMLELTDSQVITTAAPVNATTEAPVNATTTAAPTNATTAAPTTVCSMLVFMLFRCCPSLSLHRRLCFDVLFLSIFNKSLRQRKTLSVQSSDDSF
jgi:hypothetical protein